MDCSMVIDVRFFSLSCEYVLLPLVNKKAVLACGKSKLNTGRKKGESGRCHVTAKGERQQKLTGKPQLCGDTQINRNGLI